MVVVNNFYAYKDAPVTGESKETTNMSAETLSVQVTGLNGTLKVVGATDLCQRDTKPYEFQEYFEYCEFCKKQIKEGL